MFLALGHAHSMFKDDPWQTKVMSEFELLQEDGENIVEWDIDAWTGRDLSKFWVKSAGEYSDSEFENANIELVYSQAVIRQYLIAVLSRIFFNLKQRIFYAKLQIFRQPNPSHFEAERRWHICSRFMCSLIYSPHPPAIEAENLKW